MSRFVIDRFKARAALGIAVVEFADGKANISGLDGKSVRELEFIFSKSHSTPHVDTAGTSALALTTYNQLEPGSEEHLMAVIRTLHEYGFSARQVD
ncbi:MAG TPA: hypothetical protein VGK02_01120 [Candidatus Aquicultor sp.]